jgi:hypothetical protein
MAKNLKKTEAASVVEEKVTSATDVATPTIAVEPVQLTIADLQLLARIVDLASRRGAFQAGELSQVGDSYNKLSGFLAYVESTQQKNTEVTEETPAA